MKNLKMDNKIKLLIMDVDGTLTDGKIYMGEGGEIFKVFNAKDGYGIKNILPELGIIPVIITARKSKILESRCHELNILELYQDISDKKIKLDEIIGAYSEKLKTKLEYGNVAFIGDDIPDLQCMTLVQKSGGIVGCPADAVKEIKEISDFISTKNGGDGAVREFIEDRLSTLA